jgi:hypothetical protein
MGKQSLRLNPPAYPAKMGEVKTARKMVMASIQVRMYLFAGCWHR